MDDKPGFTWVKSFLHRHPKISICQAESLPINRALGCSQKNLDAWFKEFKQFLTAHDLLDKSDRICLGRSEFGWMHSDLFDGWLRCHFSNSIPPARPVVVLLDGHSSHINYEAVKFASNSTACHHTHAHAVQPCDVGLFKPIKEN